MDSSLILSNYLTKNSSLESIISFSQFTKLFSKNISKHFIKSIYNELCKDRYDLLSRINDKIKSRFEIPTSKIIKNLSNMSNFAIEKESLLSIEQKLKKLKDKLDIQCLLFTNDIKTLLDQIYYIIEKLKNINQCLFETNYTSNIDKDKDSILKCIEKVFNKRNN